MKSFIGVKRIEAKPMTRGQFCTSQGKELDPSEGLADEPGYCVRYTDTYISWSPKVAFEEAYSEVLPDGFTFQINRNPTYKREEWQERVIVEFDELHVKVRDLTTFMNTSFFHDMDDLTKLDFDIQLRSMTVYLNTLYKRIGKF